jgi:hypothetical protein
MVKILIAGNLIIMDLIKAKLPNFGAFFLSCFSTTLYANTLILHLRLNSLGLRISHLWGISGMLILAVFLFFTQKYQGVEGWLFVRKWIKKRNPNKWIIGGFSLLYFVFSIVLFYYSLPLIGEQNHE